MNAKAIIIQKNVRAWLLRRRYQKRMKHIVLVQSLVRRFLAKRELKRLKIEAKSVEHQKKLNQGLENKIISLQQKLTASEKLNKELKVMAVSHEEMVKEVEVLRKSEQEGKIAMKTIGELEAELQRVKQDLDRERSEKVDLVNERQKELSEWHEKESSLTREIESLQENLKAANEMVETSGQVTSEEFVRRLDEEKAIIHAEYEQERIAYQKLLKDYNRLEAQFENLQDELHQARGGDPGERSMSTLSFASSFVGEMPGEEESAYGSQSGNGSFSQTYSTNRKPFRNARIPTFPRPKFNAFKWSTRTCQTGPCGVASWRCLRKQRCGPDSQIAAETEGDTEGQGEAGETNRGAGRLDQCICQ